MRLFLPTALTTMLLAASYTSASAHGIWVAERHGEHAIVYGHGSSDDSYDPAKLGSVIGKSADGSTVEIALDKRDDHVLLDVPKNAAVVVSTLDNGYWTEGPDGEWHNKAKAEIEGAKQAGRYLKYSVSMLGEVSAELKPQGLDLEIVPAVDPATLHAGDTVEVLVLFKGAPAKDVVVISEYTTDSDNESVKTDDAGKAKIVVRNQGLNVVAVSVDEPLADDPNADKVGHFSTLSFNIGHSVD